MASGILISSLGPEPSEDQIMKFMQGMMGAMSALMGLSMSIKHDAELQQLLTNASLITLPLIYTSAALGLYVRYARRKRNVR